LLAMTLARMDTAAMAVAEIMTGLLLRMFRILFSTFVPFWVGLPDPVEVPDR